MEDAEADESFEPEPRLIVATMSANLTRNGLTDNAEIAETLKCLRVHGAGGDKYDNARIGLNARLDTLQAAILLEKLAILEDEINLRNAVAERYNAEITKTLGNRVIVPEISRDTYSAWAQYTIRVPNGDRDGVVATLKEQGIPTAIYYPKPLHRHTAYRDFPVVDGGCPVADELAGAVLSLPMYPYLDVPTQDRIVATLAAALPGSTR